MRKLRSKKGFTLAELLIVVAVIAILVAIAIPVFSTQLDNAKKQVDAANLRTAESVAMNEFLSAGRTEKTSYGFKKTDKVDAQMEAVVGAQGDIMGKAKDNTKKTIEVVINADGKIESAGWEEKKAA